MALVAFIDLVKLLDDAGFPGGTAQANGIAVVAAESGRDPSAKGTNTDGSIDRGLWQINNKFHAEVTDDCAYDPVCATAAALKISNGGLDYTPWSAFTNGAYKNHLEAAKVALDSYARIKTLNKTVDSLSRQLTSTQTQVSNLQNQVSVLQGQNSTLQSQLNTANSSLSAAQQQITSLQSQLDSVNAQLTSAQTNLSDDDTLITNLKAAISDAETALSQAQSALSSV
jgi:septal ring factor EnvC (AmiA/AmiB activator)